MNPPAIAQFLGRGDGLISKVRVSSLDRTRHALDLVAATVDAPGFVEHAIFGEDLVDGRASTRGVDRVAAAIKATHPDFQYQPIAEPEELGNGGRVKWVSGRPGEAPAYAGTDFIIARDGRIAALYLFFDELP